MDDVARIGERRGPPTVAEKAWLCRVAQPFSEAGMHKATLATVGAKGLSLPLPEGPPLMYPLDVTMPQAGCCVAGGLEFGAGSILGSVRCGGTGLPQASGLFVSLPFRRAIARLVPSVCETLPPREGGLHARLTVFIIAHAMAKQLPLS